MAGCSSPTATWLAPGSALSGGWMLPLSTPGLGFGSPLWQIQHSHSGSCRRVSRWQQNLHKFVLFPQLCVQSCTRHQQNIDCRLNNKSSIGFVQLYMLAVRRLKIKSINIYLFDRDWRATWLDCLQMSMRKSLTREMRSIASCYSVSPFSIVLLWRGRGSDNWDTMWFTASIMLILM